MAANWANPGFLAPHEFDTGTTNALTVFNIDSVRGLPPRADRNKMAALFRASPDLFVNIATPDNYYNAFIAPRRDIQQTGTSGYAQADVRLTSKLRVLGGVRFGSNGVIGCRETF